MPIIISGKAKIFRKTYAIIGKPFELGEFYGKKLTDEIIKDLEVVVADKMKALQSELFERIKNEKAKRKGGAK